MLMGDWAWLLRGNEIAACGKYRDELARSLWRKDLWSSYRQQPASRYQILSCQEPPCMCHTLPGVASDWVTGHASSRTPHQAGWGLPSLPCTLIPLLNSASAPLSSVLIPNKQLAPQTPSQYLLSENPTGKMVHSEGKKEYGWDTREPLTASSTANGRNKWKTSNSIATGLQKA